MPFAGVQSDGAGVTLVMSSVHDPEATEPDGIRSVALEAGRVRNRSTSYRVAVRRLRNRDRTPPHRPSLLGGPHRRRSGNVRLPRRRAFLIPFLAAAAFLLVACQPEPVEIASYPHMRTLSSVSGDGRFVVVGTQNDDITVAGTASLSVEDRDVNGNGKLDEPGDTSFTTYFGEGGSNTTGLANIDDASLFVPDISDDGSTLVFEAYNPDNTTPPSPGLAPVNDCVYEIAVEDLATGVPTLVDCAASGLAAGSYLDGSCRAT